MGHIFRASALALATGLGGLTFLTQITSAQAEQADQQPGSYRTAAAQDPGNVQDRLERVEKELEKRKVERDKVRLERTKRIEKLKKKAREWDTNFDLLRRDPRNNLGLKKDNWMGFEKLDTQVRFGGFLQVNLIHNFQDTNTKFAKFEPGKFPVPSGKTTSTEFSPRMTRLIFESRTPTPIGQYSTFISIDFFGNNDPGTIEPRLRQAYLTGVGVITGQAFLIGQAFSTFRDLQVFPEMFDLTGPNAWSRLFNGMVRFSFEIDQPHHWTATIALEDPDTDLSNGNDQTELPDGIARIDYNGNLTHFMAAIIGRQLKGTNTGGSGTDRAFGYGIEFTGKIGIPNVRDTFKFQGFYGSGIGRYINDLDAAGGQDAVYDTTKKQLTRLESFGGFGAYQHWWTARLRSTAVFGIVRVSNLTLQSATAFKESYYSLANLIYSPFKHFDIGMEYKYGQRKNKDDNTGHASRMMVSAKWHY
jgi:hypothetical protein